MSEYRALILGLPGSGKTTFARRLASRLSCGHIESDAAFWDESGRERLDFRARIDEALRAPDDWIVEGHYGKLKDLIDPLVTHVYWLDYRWPVVFRRWLGRSLKSRDFGDWLWLTFKRHELQDNYAEALKRARDKGASVVRFRSPKSAAQFLETLTRRA